MAKRSDKKNKSSASFIALVLYAGVLFFMVACSGNKKQKPAAKVREKDFAKPRITLLSELPEKDMPRVIWLDKVHQPPVINATISDSVGKPTGKGKTFPHTDTSYKAIVTDTKGIGFFETFTTDEGLGLDQIYCSYKDKWGNLWFGTNGGGVSKYDGKNFTSYTTAHGLASNVIWCITQDHEGNLWFGTDGSGVSKYDGESFTSYGTAQGLPDNVVFSIVEDKKNNVWFGTLNGGVGKWDGKRFTSYSTKEGLTNNTVKIIFEDSKSNLWFGTHGGGVSKYNGKNFTSYTTKEGLAANKVWSIAEDNSGNMWFGTEGKGVSKYDGKAIVNYALFSDTADDGVVCMAKDKQGVLWFGTQKSGVIKYDGRTFIRYSTANGLANNQIRAITVDEKGNLWFGSFGSGICKFAGNSFTNFTTAQGLAGNVVFSMEEDRESNLWLGTSGGGVCRYNGKGFAGFTKADGLAHNDVYCVLKDRAGNLWFGTGGGGISKYNGKSFTSYTTLQGLASNIVFSMIEDKKGNLWFGTSGGGVSKYDGKSFTNYTTLQGLAGNVVFGIKEDRNSNLWFGTLGGGVSKFTGTGFTNYTVAQGLSDNMVWTVTEDRQGNLWFGTQHGLSLMPKEKITQASEDGKATENVRQPLFTSFSTKEGLPNDFITQVVQGDGEKLYAGTNLGVCEILPAKGSHAAAKEWTVGRVFNTEHGYPVKDVNAGLNAMFKDSKGIIWIGTGSDKTGLVRFEPDALINSSSLPPRVLINQVKINNEDVCWRDIDDALRYKANADSISSATLTEEITTYGKRLTGPERDSIRLRFANIRFDGITRWQSLPQKLVLPYYFNNVSFSFGVIETGKNFLVNYKYFLEGYDKDWSPASRTTYINFGNIFEGRYTFKVKAQSPEGVWGDPVIYSFTVLPPWWRTWWMFAAYAILSVASILLFSWWRHKQIIYQKKVLEHQVAVATKQVREETEKVEVQKKKIEYTLKELKEKQAQLIQSEKMASLGELTAGIAHEIQNPLNFVTNFSEVSNELIKEMNEELDAGNVEEAKAIASDIGQSLEKINHHGKRAGAIVKGMLHHSRTSTGIKEPTDINALADEYLRLAYHGLRAKDKSFNAALKTDYDESIGTINIIPQDIGRVILNLITNAFYAVSEKKKQQLPGYEPTVSVCTKKANGNVLISIKDNGNGMPKSIIDKIFQPFFTTKPTGEGTGLGLSMSYDIVTKAHNGDLIVNTREGEGSEFIIELPH